MSCAVISRLWPSCSVTCRPSPAIGSLVVGPRGGEIPRVDRFGFSNGQGSINQIAKGIQGSDTPPVRPDRTLRLMAVFQYPPIRSAG